MKLLAVFALSLSVMLSALVIAAVLLGRSLPAGDRFSFDDANGATIDIYALDPSRGVKVDLTRTPANDVEEAWSSDGRRMAFISDRGGKPQLYLLTLGSGGGTRLLDGEAISSNYRPVWSPDGKALVYQVVGTLGDDIAVIEVDQPLTSSNPHVLVPSRTEDRYPVWSPDGTIIAFSSWRSGDAEIYLVRPDGSGLINLTHAPNDDVSPSWSPDGQQIAFFSLRSGFRELYVMRRDGSAVRQLTDAHQPNDGTYWGAPVWSPDGQSLAYQAVTGSQSSIVVVGQDGTFERHLINGQVADRLINGQRLAYLARPGERALLYLTEANGLNPRVLTPMDAAGAFSTLWTPSAP